MGFLSAFCSYLLLFMIMVAIAGIGIFIGITLRKQKDLKAIQEEGPEES
ncbi:MAG: vanadium nitrogenase [Lachnospiraceae bacterium]|nr:vanadium nitrogenase [Lachnospiraceae bacterium]